MKEPRALKRLPRSLDDIRGLRVARWIRESTAGQYDRYGPASQREQQDRFIERHGLVDTGLVFQVAHSGRTVWRSATMTEMLAEARVGAFDLLLAGYSDRWQRNLRRTLELLEDGLNPAGVALVMCDRRILSSDPHDWDVWWVVARSRRLVARLARRMASPCASGKASRSSVRLASSRSTMSSSARSAASGVRSSRDAIATNRRWRSTDSAIRSSRGGVTPGSSSSSRTGGAELRRRSAYDCSSWIQVQVQYLRPCRRSRCARAFPPGQGRAVGGMSLRCDVRSIRSDAATIGRIATPPV